MRLARCLVLLAALGPAAAAWAETPLSAVEFEARTTGRTMTYAQGGQVWGREQYLADRKVIWAFEGEDCRSGRWDEPQPGLICFAYDYKPADLQCWRFFDEGGTLMAQFQLTPEADMLSVVEESVAPLGCPGPEVGV